MRRQSAAHEPELADDDRVLYDSARLANGKEREARVGGDPGRRRRGGGVERWRVREAAVVAAGFARPLGSRRGECDKEQFHA